MNSTPWSRAKARSARSLAVSAGMARATSGTFTPLRSDSAPPTRISVSRWSSRWRVTPRRSLPSSSSRVVPIRAAAMISGWGSCTRRTSPGTGERSSRKGWPAWSCTRPAPNLPTRSFGPCTSARMPMGRPVRRSISRMVAIRAAWSSWLPWEKLRRNTSAPARNRRSITCGSALAGPRVAIIFVRRRRRMGMRLDRRDAPAGGVSGRAMLSGGTSMMRATSSTRSGGMRRHWETAAVEMPSPVAIRVTAPRWARRDSRDLSRMALS